MIGYPGSVSVGLAPPVSLSNILDQHGAISSHTSIVQIPGQTSVYCQCCTGEENSHSLPATTGESSDKISKSAELSQIQSINSELKAKGMEWTAGETSVSQYTPEAFQRFVGTNLSMMGHDPAHEITTSMTGSYSLPSSFSLRNFAGKNYTTPIRNQKTCGSCWSFAITGMFESWKKLYARSGTWMPDWAEQYLLSCNRYGYSCSGGNWFALNHLFSTSDVRGGIGTVTESQYPYTAIKTRCKSLSGYSRVKFPATVGGVRTTWHYYYGMGSVTLLKQLLYNYGPVIVGIKGNDPYFRAYKTGIFDNPGAVSGTDHAVMLVGWGTNNGRTYWIMKNSWGTGWGERGWMRIYAGENNVGIQPAYISPGPWYTPASLQQKSSSQNKPLAGT